MAQDHPGGTPPAGGGTQPGGSQADALAYLRQHHERYTREALTRQLIDAGYDPTTIDRAWAALPQAGLSVGRTDRRSIVAWGIFAAYAGTWLVFTLGWSGQSLGNYSSVLLVSGIFAVALGIPALIGIVLARRSGGLRSATTGTVIAAALVPLVVLVGIAGLCAAVIPPFGA